MQSSGPRKWQIFQPQPLEGSFGGPHVFDSSDVLDELTVADRAAQAEIDAAIPGPIRSSIDSPRHGSRAAFVGSLCNLGFTSP
jgi:hypothetical protein